MEKSENTVPLALPSAPNGQRSKIVHLPVREHDRPATPPSKSKKTRRHSLWYALYFPQLTTFSDARQRTYLQQLASLATHVSSSVSFHPLSLILEIRSSLKYFGGIDALHGKLQPLITAQLQQWQLRGDYLYGASPTATGSLLLARGGHNTLVYQKDNLRSALGQLSADVLELDQEQRRRLHNMGIRRLRDIWRLPVDGLRKRFGSEFINQLNRALGKRAEPLEYYQAPPAFSSSYDLPCEIENLALLLSVIDEIIAQLEDFLRRRDLSISQLVLFLAHEQQSSTEINLGLRQPSRCREHLMLLLETHLLKLSLPAPVVRIKVEVRQFDAFIGHSNELAGLGRNGGEDNAQAISQRERTSHYQNHKLNQFMEQLYARLGDQRVKNIGSVAEYCPEYASVQRDQTEPGLARASNKEVPGNPRPFWLLTTPQQLAIRHGKLYHQRPIEILSGPERIETRWWSGTDIRRDYYVALEKNGSRLWIYREKTGARHWYLHGIFS